MAARDEQSAGVARAVAIDRPARVAAPARAARGSSRQQPAARSARPARTAKQRSPRFYYGFGVVGLVLSAILAESTVASYNSAVSKYPGQLAAYHAAMAKYTAAHGHGMSAPKLPTHPTLTILDFILPILYGALSIAYIYLGYRAARGQQRTANAG